MSVTHVVGIDPGLVHTGVVSMLFDAEAKEISLAHTAVVGPDAPAVNQAIADLWVMERAYVPPAIFIEGYRPRSNLNSDKRMVEAVARIKACLPGSEVLLNTGVKKVVRQPLMELLGVWKFSTVTHHQDLRSAARIALLGMLRDEILNGLLADVVRDHLAGETWQIQ